MSGFGKQKEQPRKAGPKKTDRPASDAENVQQNTQSTIGDGPSTRKVDRPAALEQVLAHFPVCEACTHKYSHRGNVSLCLHRHILGLIA